MLDFLKKIFASEDSPKDPVCGMVVDPKTALSVTSGGRRYYFCSANCKGQFLKKPNRNGSCC